MRCLVLVIEDEADTARYICNGLNEAGHTPILIRDGARGLAENMDRLHRSCRRLIWLNPLLRWAGFEPKSQGIRAMLPHVDDFRPVHNLASLRGLVDLLSRPAPPRSVLASVGEPVRMAS